jgi:hypothetical protein
MVGTTVEKKDTVKVLLVVGLLAFQKGDESVDLLALQRGKALVLSKVDWKVDTLAASSARKQVEL